MLQHWRQLCECHPQNVRNHLKVALSHFYRLTKWRLSCQQIGTQHVFLLLHPPYCEPIFSAIFEHHLRGPMSLPPHDSVILCHNCHRSFFWVACGHRKGMTNTEGRQSSGWCCATMKSSCEPYGQLNFNFDGSSYCNFLCTWCCCCNLLCVCDIFSNELTLSKMVGSQECVGWRWTGLMPASLGHYLLKRTMFHLRAKGRQATPNLCQNATRYWLRLIREFQKLIASVFWRICRTSTVLKLREKWFNFKVWAHSLCWSRKSLMDR